MNEAQQQRIRAETQTIIHDALTEYEALKPRSTQLHIGPSEVGYCREYIRAKIAGDPQKPPAGVKWAAFIGTATGDMLESLMEIEGARTQVKLSYLMPTTGIEVSGSCDVLWPQVDDGAENGAVWDFKSKDGLDGIMRDGPQRKEMIQVSIYLLAALAADHVREGAVGTLVYFDRSGKDKQVWTVSVDTDDARRWIEVAEELLADVEHALATGQSQGPLRDETEQKCWYFGCPFYDACWAGYQPDGEITDPAVINAMEKYDAGRQLQARAKKLMDEAKFELGVAEAEPIRGQSEDWMLDWKLRESRGMEFRTIDLRRRR